MINFKKVLFFLFLLLPLSVQGVEIKVQSNGYLRIIGDAIPRYDTGFNSTSEGTAEGSYRSAQGRVWRSERLIILPKQCEDFPSARKTLQSLLDKSFTPVRPELEGPYPYGLTITCRVWTGEDMATYSYRLPAENIDINTDCNITVPSVIDFGEQFRESKPERSIQGIVTCNAPAKVNVAVSEQGKVNVASGVVANIYVNNNLGNSTFDVNQTAGFSLLAKLDVSRYAVFGAYSKAMIVYFDLP